MKAFFKQSCQPNADNCGVMVLLIAFPIGLHNQVEAKISMNTQTVDDFVQSIHFKAKLSIRSKTASSKSKVLQHNKSKKNKINDQIDQGRDKTLPSTWEESISEYRIEWPMNATYYTYIQPTVNIYDSLVNGDPYLAKKSLEGQYLLLLCYNRQCFKQSRSESTLCTCRVPKQLKYQLPWVACCLKDTPLATKIKFTKVNWLRNH